MRHLRMLGLCLASYVRLRRAGFNGGVGDSASGIWQVRSKSRTKNRSRKSLVPASPRSKVPKSIERVGKRRRNRKIQT